MYRHEYYVLTVHYFPRAAAADEPPFECHGYTEEEWKRPGAYRPHTFEFTKAPTRDDFLTLCGENLPWTYVWEGDLLPLLSDKDRNAWPMVDWMHKAASTDIFDAAGLKVGRLDVHRHWLAEGVGYDRNRIAFSIEERDSVLRNLPAGKVRVAARVLLEDTNFVNRIKEAISCLKEGERDSDAVMGAVIKLVQKAVGRKNRVCNAHE